jgi:hypothetical protein
METSHTPAAAAFVFPISAIGHRQPPQSYPDIALNLLHCSPLPVLGSVVRSRL